MAALLLLNKLKRWYVNMKEFFISTILPILIGSLKTILMAVIAFVGKETVLFIRTRQTKIDQEIKATGHAEDMKTAWEVWCQVEEKFRITENIDKFVNSKADMFEGLLLKKCPYLNKQDAEDIRFAIAGEFNKDKQAVLSNSDIINQLQTQVETLKQENESLNNKINQAKNAIV